MNKPTKAEFGFTLVEILVAVGVLAVGSLAFLPSFSGASKQKSLAQSVENAKDAVATARNRALTEVGNPGLDPGSADSYKYSGAKFTDGSSTYQLFRSTTADVTTCTNVPTSGVSVLDGQRTLLTTVEPKLPTGESPTCFFFEFGSGDAYVTKGSDPAYATKSCQN